MRPLALGLLGLLIAVPAVAQDGYGRYYDQQDLEKLLYGQRQPLEELPEVTYRYHVIDHPTSNSIWARHAFYDEIGGGDVQAGKALLPTIEFLNYTRVQNLGIGDTLVVPSELGLDFRAYSPFPRTYPGAEDLDKLVIIHKGAQAWAAYAHGRLERWGLVNTGAPGTRTPSGRYNYNWQEPERISSESPPGEEWYMRWVFNFHNARGFHTHQYVMPTGAPGSHGCVRMIEADAKWIYEWADPWTTTAGEGALGGKILEQGTMVLVLGEGEEPEGPPQRFVHTPDGPVINAVELPADPWSVPPGTAQQEFYDRQRAQRAAAGDASES
ncbi:MAG: L,D-transpeptidase [Rhodothermales bacterium]|nr:L,D-transpeptidase [Rhodothermales bacterium]